MEKVLNMALKPVFMRAIRNGSKKWEYRDYSTYWGEKLIDVESYGGKDIMDIMDGIYSGELEFKPREYTHILFHESGTQKTLKVECLGTRYYRGHLGFAIQLGEIIKGK